MPQKSFRLIFTVRYLSPVWLCAKWQAKFKVKTAWNVTRLDSINHDNLVLCSFPNRVCPAGFNLKSFLWLCVKRNIGQKFNSLDRVSYRPIKNSRSDLQTLRRFVFECSWFLVSYRRPSIELRNAREYDFFNRFWCQMNCYFMR